MHTSWWKKDHAAASTSYKCVIHGDSNRTLMNVEKLCIVVPVCRNWQRGGVAVKKKYLKRSSFSFAGQCSCVRICLVSTDPVDRQKSVSTFCGSSPYPCGSLTYRDICQAFRMRLTSIVYSIFQSLSTGKSNKYLFSIAKMQNENRFYAENTLVSVCFSSLCISIIPWHPNEKQEYRMQR